MTDNPEPELDFDFSAHSTTRGRTALYTVPDLPGPIVLETLPASASLNPPWFSDFLRSPRQRRPAGNLDADEIARRFDEDRRENRAWAVKHLLRGWRGVKNSRTGEPVPFTADAAKVLIGKLPDHIFDAYYLWCHVESNFTPAMARIDVESLAGN